MNSITLNALTPTTTVTFTTHKIERTTIELMLIYSVLAILWVATSQGTLVDNRNPTNDRLYYRKVRKNVNLAPPAWLFGGVWIVWLIFFLINTVLFVTDDGITKENIVFYKASEFLYFAWIFVSWIWTPLFFRPEAIFLCILDSIFLLLITLLQLFVQVKAGETRWWSTYLLLLPIAFWSMFLILLTMKIFSKRKQINETFIHSESKNEENL